LQKNVHSRDAVKCHISHVETFFHVAELLTLSVQVKMFYHSSMHIYYNDTKPK